MDLVHELRQLVATFRGELEQANDESALNDLKGRYLGKQRGALQGYMSRLKEAAQEDRRAWGAAINEAKNTVEEALRERVAALRSGKRTPAASGWDPTLPGRRMPLGRIHPLTATQRRLEELFISMGYAVEEGPEVETEDNNFALLNFPPDHPSRDMQDTFYLEGGRLLRTHTSPVQIRTMLRRKPPIKMICPGRVFRRDDDASHSPMFHQVEGLVVDRGIHFGHLKGTLEAVVGRMFGPGTPIRLRPSFFPFTEPSAEVDVRCVMCAGKGCSLCKRTGWMEILGSGMVHPQVLRNVGIDPEVYTGFAFGMGVDRIAMLVHGMDHIRHLYENDVRFLKQF